MSKLSQKLKAKWLDERRPIKNTLTTATVEDQWITVPELPSCQIYDLSVTFKTRVSASSVDKPGDQLTPLVLSARRHVIEDVYGEFRPYFGKLHGALARGDDDSLREHLAEFERVMFDVHGGSDE